MSIQPFSSSSSTRAPAPGGDDKLRDAAVGLQAVLFQQILEVMRETVTENEVFNGGFGEDVFTSQLDEHFSQLMSGSIDGGLTDAIYRQLQRGASREDVRSVQSLGSTPHLPILEGDTP